VTYRPGIDLKVEFFDGVIIGFERAGDGCVEVSARRQRPEAEHFKEAAAHLGADAFPVGAGVDVGEGGVGDFLHLAAEVGVADVVAAGRVGRRIGGAEGQGGEQEQEDGEEAGWHGGSPAGLRSRNRRTVLYRAAACGRREGVEQLHAQRLHKNKQAINRKRGLA
jgi:hypothetical protein